jgi:hypothetical protein
MSANSDVERQHIRGATVRRGSKSTYRYDAPADFVGDENDVAGQGGEQFDQGRRLAVQQRAVNRRAGLGLRCRAAGEEQVGQPQRQAID